MAAIWMLHVFFISSLSNTGSIFLNIFIHSQDTNSKHSKRNLETKITFLTFYEINKHLTFFMKFNKRNLAKSNQTS